jgi:hypothetical protein
MKLFVVKKIIFYFFLLSLIPNFSYAQFLEMHYTHCYMDTSSEVFNWGLIDHDLKGKVQTMIFTRYYALKKSSEVQKGKMISKNIYLFNENRKEIQDTLYRPSATNVLTKFQYDDSANVTDMSSFRLDGKLICRFKFKYDGNNNKTEERYYNAADSLEYKMILIYDSNGNLIKSTNHKTKENKDILFTAKYDNRNNEIEAVINAEDSIYGYKLIEKYDAKGNKTEQSSYSFKGVLNYKSTFTYDSVGNITEWYTYNADTSLDYKYAYKYNTERKNTEAVQTDSDGKQNKCTCNYDDHSKKTETVKYNIDGTVGLRQTFKYVYDEKGNWTSMTEYVNNVPKTITEREIKYF